MVIIIDKDTTKEQISEALKKMDKKNNKPSLVDFFGKLKGKYEDGLTYQRELRNEWD